MLDSLTKNRRVAVAIICFMLVMIVGCGKPKKPEGSLSGIVKLNESIFTDGMVTVSNDSLRVYMNVKPDQNGRYEIKHLMPGKYRISIQPVPNEFNTGEVDVPRQTIPFPIPKKYRSEDTSGMEFEVAVGENKFDISMTK